MLSPLRYPGSKADFADTFKSIYESKHAGLPLVEPFAGSAAISLAMLAAGATPHATLVERDPLLYCFWKCVFERPKDLVEGFLELPITLKTWHKFQPLLGIDAPTKRNTLSLALAGLFFNRANFSGILDGGPIGGEDQSSEYKIDCRTNKSDTIARIVQISEFASNVTVKFGNGLDQVKHDARRSRVFYYVDPPYFVMGHRLYRYHFRHKDHKDLAAALNRASFPWVLSYDHHHVIEFLYEDCHVRRHSFLYSAKNSKRHQELVIANFDLPQTLFVPPPKRKRPARVNG
jgi:DNA adenine methylase